MNLETFCIHKRFTGGELKKKVWELIWKVKAIYLHDLVRHWL